MLSRHQHVAVTGGMPWVLGLSMILLIAVYWGGLTELVTRWNRQEEYGHGFFIPLISLWLLWQRREALRVGVGQPSLWGFVLLALAVAMLVLGELTAIFILVQYGFLVALLALVLVFDGFPLARLTFLPIALLVFAIPLPYFVDWLLEKVHLVEITAYADADAYTIFETMNDRGLSLTATDMLKGYLLASIEQTDKRAEANKEIKHWLLELNEVGKETEADFFKAWLRAKYAEGIRERKKGAKPEDFDLIGTEYHRWVRNHHEQIGLNVSDEFNQWVKRDLRFFARTYLNLLKAAETLKPGLESVRFNADHGFTQQFQVLLAPLLPTDDEATVHAKVKLAADYIDCWLNRRLWNSRSIDYSTVQYSVFLLTKELRNLSLPDLRQKLITRLTADCKELPFDNQPHLNMWNAKSLNKQLARFTHWLEIESGQAGSYNEYIVRSGKNAYEIEHLWANHFERHTDEFESVQEFLNFRNGLGGLILLPKKINASLNDKTYQDKLEHYQKENLLACSLHPACYQHNPGFVQMMNRTKLPFQAHSSFKRADFQKRFELYKSIAEILWSVERLEAAV